MLNHFRFIIDDILQNAVTSELPIDVYSTVLGGKVEVSDLLDPNYWINHVAKGVLYDQGMKSVVRDDFKILVEVGPQNVLTKMAKPWLRPLTEKELFWVG